MTTETIMSGFETAARLELLDQLRLAETYHTKVKTFTGDVYKTGLHVSLYAKIEKLVETLEEFRDEIFTLFGRARFDYSLQSMSYIEVLHTLHRLAVADQALKSAQEWVARASD